MTEVQKAGVPFEISFVAKNNGSDGHMTVQVMDGEDVAAEKFVALDEGQFRVISVELTLEAGEHVITVGAVSYTHLNAEKICIKRKKQKEEQTRDKNK